jgi:MFS family permease
VPSAPGGGERHFAWFSAALSSWFTSFGMQSTLFAWLLVGELGASDEWVGIAQTANMLPSIVLLLVGGAVADRVDPRRMLVVLHLLGSLPVLLLAGAVSAGGLSIPLILTFGVSMGVVTAFSMPARDTLLSRVAGPDMMRAVTTMTAVQFGSQALGALLAGGARWLGSAPMLVVQAAILLSGSFLVRGVPVRAPEPRTGPAPSALHEITEGLRMVMRTPHLRWPVVLVCAVGSLFVGPYLVTFPIIVTQVYDGTVAQLSVVMMMFPLGTIAGSLVIRRVGMRRKGAAALVALVVGAANLELIALGTGFRLMVAASLAWGMGAAVFINASRTIFQEAAPPTQRGRVLAVYQLGFMGAAPFGAVSAGFLSGQLGPLPTLQIFGLAMLVVVGMVWLGTDTAEIE